MSDNLLAYRVPPDDTKTQVEKRLKLQRICKEIEYLEGRKVPEDSDANELVVLLAKKTNIENEIRTRQRAKQLQEELSKPAGQPAGLEQPSGLDRSNLTYTSYGPWTR
ncbi:MAG: hypothetical protein FVQ80_14520 [Planctomycetes bacterium]|nr:hypothetical protein [Planctomycetota bacterium]